MQGYQERGFPWWATLPGDRNLSMGRRWHFFFAWLFLVNGLAYLSGALEAGICDAIWRHQGKSSSISAPPSRNMRG